MWRGKKIDNIPCNFKHTLSGEGYYWTADHLCSLCKKHKQRRVEHLVERLILCDSLTTLAKKLFIFWINALIFMYSYILRVLPIKQ